MLQLLQGSAMIQTSEIRLAGSRRRRPTGDLPVGRLVGINVSGRGHSTSEPGRAAPGTSLGR